MWHNEFVWPEHTAGTEGMLSAGPKDRTGQRWGMRCCPGGPFTRAQMPSQKIRFLMWTSSLHNGFHISVLIRVCKSVTVPALIYKELVYAGLNDFLTKAVWIAPAYGLPFHFILLKLFGLEEFSAVSSVSVRTSLALVACLYTVHFIAEAQGVSVEGVTSRRSTSQFGSDQKLY